MSWLKSFKRRRKEKQIICNILHKYNRDYLWVRCSECRGANCLRCGGEGIIHLVSAFELIAKPDRYLLTEIKSYLEQKVCGKWIQLKTK